MTARNSVRRPTGRHRSRVSLRRAVTPSVYGISVPVLVAASITLVGVVSASAATLGGLKSFDLGAANASTAIHTGGITATWSPLVSGSTFVVNGITLATTGSDKFAVGEQIAVSLINSSGAKICEVTVTNPTLTASVAISRATINTACGTTGIDFATVDRLAVAAGVS